jgi:hypothetical protein
MHRKISLVKTPHPSLTAASLEVTKTVLLVGLIDYALFSSNRPSLHKSMDGIDF